jgi:hypothetical protein
MLHYAARGQPLTGVEYQKQPFGPAARHLTWALQTLEDQGLLTVSRRDYFGFPKDDFLSKREPGPQSLTGDERELLGEVVDFVRLRSARQISEFSHNEAWSAVSMGERIPYYTAYSLWPVALDDSDLAWGESEARKVVAQRPAHGG